MKAYEFPVKVTSKGKLELSETLKKLLPNNQVVRIIILVNEPTDLEEQTAWSHLTAEQFIEGYAETDAVYDKV